MNKAILRASLLGLLLASLAALPAAAQIPPGPDYWVTPDNGRTFFTFPNGDVESLCGAPPSTAWNHRVNLRGVPVAADYDTVVQRLDKAVFDTTGHAQTRIVVKALSFGEARQEDVPGLYDGPFPWETLFGFHLAGMVGHDFFKRYAVTFDFETMRIFLQ